LVFGFKDVLPKIHFHNLLLNFVKFFTHFVLVGYWGDSLLHNSYWKPVKIRRELALVFLSNPTQKSIFGVAVHSQLIPQISFSVDIVSDVLIFSDLIL